jgi:hypothetical protein
MGTVQFGAGHAPLVYEMGYYNQENMKTGMEIWFEP